jgi:hypothetical protein
MTPPRVVAFIPQRTSLSYLARRAIRLEINIFVLHPFPEPFNEQIVHPAASAIHADFDIVLFKHVRNIV